jgi:hypothetical protein
MTMVNRYIRIWLLLSFALHACNNSAPKNTLFAQHFKENVDVLLANEKDSVLHIGELTSFEWDSLYIFRPYTPLNEINEKMGFKWTDSRATQINQSDDFNLLLFIKNNQVVNFVELPRNYGDFSRLVSSGPYIKNEASFYVKRSLFGGQDWIFLYSTKN